MAAGGGGGIVRVSGKLVGNGNHAITVGAGGQGGAGQGCGCLGSDCGLFPTPPTAFPTSWVDAEGGCCTEANKERDGVNGENKSGNSCVLYSN